MSADLMVEAFHEVSEIGDSSGHAFDVSLHASSAGAVRSFSLSLSPVRGRGVEIADLRRVLEIAAIHGLSVEIAERALELYPEAGDDGGGGGAGLPIEPRTQGEAA